jgi:predicted RND superfamily exporter protein
MKNLFDSVTNRPILFLVASLVFAVPFVSFSPFVKTVNNVDYFTIEDDPDVEFYDAFKEIFGNDEFFVIAFEETDIFTPQNLRLLKQITEELEDIEDIRDVVSLSNANDIIGYADDFEVRKFLEDIPDKPEQLDHLKKRAVNNPLFVKNLISPDAKTAAIVVLTYDRPNDGNYRKRLIGKTREVLDRYQNQVDEFFLAGWTTTNFRLSQYMKRDITRFIPATYILIALAVLVVFRNLRLTFLAVANVSLCMGSTMGLFALSGIPLNNVTVIVPPLVMALSLSDTVHIFSHMEKGVLSEFPDKRKALAYVLKRVVMPCFLTTVTTAVGFLSLAVSHIPPIKQFAWMASAGMVFEFTYSFFFLPPLILFFAPKHVYQEFRTGKGLGSVLAGINWLVQRYPKALAITSASMILVACWYTTKIRVETNLVEYFKASSPVRTSLRFVEERLSGVGALDISLEAQEMDAFKEPVHLNVIDTLQGHIRSLEGVDVTTSFVDFIKDMNESFHNEDSQYYKIPESREMVSQYLLLYDSDDIADYVNDTYDHARIAVRIAEHSSGAQERLIHQIRQYVEEMEHSGVNIRITGRAVQDVNTIHELVQGQVYSLSLAAGVISFIMFLVLRSVATGFLSLVPNLFPIIINFGIMGAAGVPLNTATALISAVALGIAVDDTIHFLSEYNKLRKQKVAISGSVEEVILAKGRAMVSSSLILSIGFGVLILSSFVPTINFGILSAIIMITALIGDVIVLPSIVLLKKDR